MKPPLWIVTLPTACCLAALALVPPLRAAETGESASGRAEPPAEARIAVVGLPDAAGYLGARSCAAAACHGSATPDLRPGRIRRNEYLFWFDRDPHGRGGRTLTGERSQRMLALLNVVHDGAIVDRAAYDNCLACHAPAAHAAAAASDQLLAGAINGGVDCEACHGPASRWIDEHYRAGWTSGKATELGMRNLQAPQTRAQVCTPCHVGSAERQVDHDMIAAGHPPLKFELSGFHSAWPKHFRDDELRSADADFELKLWQSGQYAASRAALELLAARAAWAAEDETKAAWPELAEYDCFACHRDLAPVAPPPAAAPAVVLPRSGWYETGRLLAAGDDSAGLDQVRAAMENGASPDPADVVQAVERALGDRQASTGAIDREELSAAVLAQLQQDPPRSWDSATQLYLALAAADAARRDDLRNRGEAPAPQDERRAILLKEVRRHLAFPAGYDSPQAAVQQQLDGSGGPTTMDSVRSNLQQAAQTLAPR